MARLFAVLCCKCHFCVCCHSDVIVVVIDVVIVVVIDVVIVVVTTVIIESNLVNYYSCSRPYCCCRWCHV